MKKLSALLLSLLLLLTACGTPATPGAAVTLPTPNDEILVDEGLHAEDLPEVCRLWFDLAETSGAADKNSNLPLASRADEGACDYLAVRLPDETYTDLIQEGKLADEGVTLADFSGGRAKQEGSYGQLAWNGELYHAFTVSAADCTLPNLTAPDGGILRLDISGDCTVDGGGTEYACFEGFDCLLVTGDGTLTVSNAAALDCGGGDLPIPSLVLDGDVTLRCDDIRLAAPNTVDVPALAVLGGTLCTDMLWLSNGMLVNAGGTLSVQGSVQELKRAVFRGGTTLLGAAEQKAEFILSGGTAHLMAYAMDKGADSSRMTLSSDAFGSQPRFDEQGRCTGLSYSTSRVLHDELVNLVQHEGFPLETALTFITCNPARVLRMEAQKGCIAEGADADLVLLGQALSIDGVFARGRQMVKNGQAIVKGRFE